MKKFYTAFGAAACLLLSTSGYAQPEWKNYTDSSLDGYWLFMPESQLRGKERAVSAATDFRQVIELAGQMKIHAYIDGGKPEDRIKRIDSMRGFTLLQIKDGKGLATVSTICTEKADTDPVAGRLLVNMINELVR